MCSYGLGHYVFNIETKMKSSVDLILVKRRYTEFVELYKLLQFERPTCIIPSIPAKDVASKIKGKDSDAIKKRRNGLEVFLQMLLRHPLLGSSAVLEDFL